MMTVCQIVTKAIMPTVLCDANHFDVLSAPGAALVLALKESVCPTHPRSAVATRPTCAILFATQATLSVVHEFVYLTALLLEGTVISTRAHLGSFRGALQIRDIQRANAPLRGVVASRGVNVPIHVCLDGCRTVGTCA